MRATLPMPASLSPAFPGTPWPQPMPASDASPLPTLLGQAQVSAPPVPSILKTPAPAAADQAGAGVPGIGGPLASLPSFDAKGEYDKVWQQVQGPKHKFNVWDFLGIVGPALQAAGGDQEGANANISRMAQARRDHMEQLRQVAMNALRWRQDEYSRAANLAADTAKPFTVGRDRVQVDPTTGQTQTLYHGPQDFEAYAAAQGLKPGTSDYNNAVQDYVLRTSGPTALGNSETLDDYRTGNRASLEGLRQNNRVSLEGLRQHNRIGLRGTPSYHDTHPSPGRASAGGGVVTATGPNGQKIKLVNGQWVPVQ